MGLGMPIRAFLDHSGAFAPDDIARLVAVFEDCLKELKLTNRDDPATTLVAKAIIEAAKQGERDPNRLREIVLKQLSP
jgi:hypothetical protein